MQADAAPMRDFEGFVAEVEPRLRHALAAALGQERGRDATAEALAYAWEHWDRVGGMENPAGYLYRVGRSRVRHRRKVRFLPVPQQLLPEVEPALPDALRRLSEQQRTVVVLVEGFGWTHREVAEALDVGVSTVETHLYRALEKLRTALGVEIDV